MAIPAALQRSLYNRSSRIIVSSSTAAPRYNVMPLICRSLHTRSKNYKNGNNNFIIPHDTASSSAAVTITQQQQRQSLCNIFSKQQQQRQHRRYYVDASTAAANSGSTSGIDLPVQLQEEIAHCRAEMEKLSSNDRMLDAMQTHLNVLETINNARKTGDIVEFDKKEATMVNIVYVLRKHSKVPENVRITPQTHVLKHLGLDSLDLAEVVMQIEEAFVMQIPDEEAFKLQTVEEVYHFIMNYEYAHVESVKMYPEMPLSDPDNDHH